MEKIGALYLGLLLLLIVDYYVAAAGELQKVNEKNVGVDQQLNNKKSVKENASESGSILNSDQIDAGKKKEGDQVDKLKDGANDGKSENVSDSKTVSKEDGNVKKGKGDTSKEDLVKDGGDEKGKNSKEDGNVKKGKGDTSKEDLVKDDGDEKGKNSKGETKSKKVPKSKGGEGTGEDPSNQKEGSSVEECSSSNMCVDSEDKMVACLRVPGDESLEFSLLIQNRGEDPVDVTISAQGSVQLEKTNIQLPGKQNKKVKVSIMDWGSVSLITLKGGNGYCNLDMKDLIAHKFGKEFQESHKSMSLKFLSRSSSLAILSFAVLLALASGWMCISFRKKQLSNITAKYQRLDMELPITGGGKTLSEINDGWDESWGDDWDDEEAPKTPSMPVTPNLSSKGLASRRLNKEAWKD